MTPALPPRDARVLAARYRLDEVIGSGSMGTVWRAWDEVVHRRVAIKEINMPPGMPEHEIRALTDRTLREARAIGALSHPHVITLYDIIVVADRPYIVMELLQARPLSQVIRDERTLSPGRTARIGAAVAAALVESHRAGITHRDVKPGNVLVEDAGRVKLTDFGIARAIDDDTMTSTGLLMGSPAYISPEVAGGSPATPLSDAWGLGGLLFACVEGRPPFDKGDPIPTLTSVVSDPVPPHPRSGPLGPVIDALLQKDPERRMNVRDAGQLLTEISRSHTDDGHPDNGHPNDGHINNGHPNDGRSGVKAAHAIAPASATLTNGTRRPVQRTPVAQPPPPWATSGNPLPALAPLPAPSGQPQGRPRWLIPAAVALALVVAAMAWFGVHLLWDLGDSLG
ncbi:serine/threonine-protein kinase [Nakamurella sp. A5-74]|uniref:non-specific serine/threonine protein kinase n=1 Tax=Nakamurella sp. A5-74 TaxID=3158264 RepID=A0AAU8DLP1_9ACTN